jgi:hypothetical protein
LCHLPHGKDAQGKVGAGKGVDLSTVGVLQECGMKTMEECINICQQTIMVYVATQILNEYRQGEQKRGEYHTSGGGNSP